MTLTHERLRELLHYDPETGVFTRRVRVSNCHVGDVAGSPNSEGYWQTRIDGVLYKNHRLAWLYMTGSWPTTDVDHKDRDTENNRWLNLRPATHKQNHENSTEMRSNTSGFRGVQWRSDTQKWRAIITHHGRKIALGCFVAKNEAIEIRELAEAMLFTHSPGMN